jgi:hypothetical protein
LSPAQGFEVRNEDEIGEVPKVTFKSDHIKVKALLSCSGGRPAAQLEVEQD